MTAHPYFKPFRQPYEDAFGGRVVMLHPESRGELRLASADPAAPIRIRQNFMSTEREWTTLRAGMRLMQDIMSRPEMAPFKAGELTPARTDEELPGAVRPMLATSQGGGRLIALSTPAGKRGWFHAAWTGGDESWHRTRVTADQCPRISREFLDEELRELGAQRPGHDRGDERGDHREQQEVALAIVQ